MAGRDNRHSQGAATRPLPCPGLSVSPTRTGPCILAQDKRALDGLFARAALGLLDARLAQLGGFALGLGDTKRSAAGRFGLVELIFFSHGFNLTRLF